MSEEKFDHLEKMMELVLKEIIVGEIKHGNQR